MEKVNGNKWEPRFDNWWKFPIVPKDAKDMIYQEEDKSDDDRINGIYPSLDTE